MYQPLVTILIPVKNVARFIRVCLEALLSQDYPQEKIEILVLDNDSQDGTLEIVKNFGEKVKLIQCGVDSPPKKYNLVLPKIKSEIIGLVDGDAIVDSLWLKKVVEPLAEAGIAGAAGVILTQNKDKLIPRVIGYELQDRYERLPREIKRAASMHAVYKTEIIKKLGGFNEKLKTGYDCELGYRINEAGFKIIFVPEAKVWHHHRESLSAYIKQQYEYGMYALPRYLERPKIALGDEITSFWTIFQPILYFSSFIFLILFLIFKTPWQMFLTPLLILFFSYFYSSLRLSLKYKDFATLALLIIFPIRPIAGSLGALRMFMKMISGKS